MTLRAAVVGCGFIGASGTNPAGGIQSHAAAWRAHPGVTLAGLVDPDPERRDAAAARWGAPAFESVAAMLAAIRPQVVSVATPDATHAEVLGLVLAAPSVRAVLAEKPLALDPVAAERLAAEASERGIVLSVNHVRRFAPSHRQLARWLGGGPIGPIELVRGCYTRGLKHNGTHWLDLVRWLVGEIDAVEGHGDVPPGADDATIDVSLQFAGGARGRLHGLTAVPYSLFELDLIGRDGRVRVIENGARIECFGVGASRRFPGFRELVPVAGPDGGLADLLMHAATDLIESLTTGRLPAATGFDAVVALRLADRALRSATAGKEGYATVDR
ncbi:MAG: Gfo/Idh/MocA family protein [Gemmatimonadales bacterium]